MTRIGVHQPNYFPWIGYFHKLAAVDVFVLLDNVEFQHGNAKSVTNRTAIKLSHGHQRITVPILRTGAPQSLQDVRVDERQRWKHKHLGSLKAAYGRAPAFSSIFPAVAAVIESAGDSLAALNRQSIEVACRLLGIETPLFLASSLDLRATEKSERLVEICRKVGGTAYLSGQGGRRYNDEQLFESNGIQLEYPNFACPEYPQLHGAFVPNLSILDLLFNCGRDARRLLA
jgi:hypothetical protein